VVSSIAAPHYCLISSGRSRGLIPVLKSDLQRCCAVDTVGEFYAELHRRSGVLKEGTIDIFDKTPRYFWDIPRYYEKVRVPLLRLTGTLADLFSPTTPGALPVKSSGHGMPVIKRESCAILRLFMPAVICLR